MFCPKCGTLLPDTTKFCFKCGWEVTQQAEEVPHTSSQPPQQTEENSPQAQEQSQQNAERNTPPMPEQSAQNKTSSSGSLKKIVSAAIAILILAVIIYSGQRHPVSDLKDVVFDNYGTATFGDAVDRTMRNVEWSTEKVSKTHYQVTVDGFIPNAYANVSLVFDLNYSDNKVYASLDHVIWDGQYQNDVFSASYAMSTIYGD